MRPLILFSCQAINHSAGTWKIKNFSAKGHTIRSSALPASFGKTISLSAAFVEQPVSKKVYWQKSFLAQPLSVSLFSFSFCEIINESGGLHFGAIMGRADILPCPAILPDWERVYKCQAWASDTSLLANTMAPARNKGTGAAKETSVMAEVCFAKWALWATVQWIWKIQVRTDEINNIWPWNAEEVGLRKSRHQQLLTEAVRKTPHKHTRKSRLAGHYEIWIAKWNHQENNIFSSLISSMFHSTCQTQRVVVTSPLPTG